MTSTPRPSLLPRANFTRALFAFVAVLLFFYLKLFQDALIDDAYITLRYAKTLLESGTWGLYPNHISNTATSPLNVMLLTLVSLITRSPVESVLWLTLLELLVLALALRGIGNHFGLPLFGWLAFAAFLFNPLWMSTLGLESVLFTTLFVTALYFFLTERFDAFALACGLLTLTRPEGSLLLLVCLYFLPNTRARLRAIALALLLVVPWYIFTWIALGSLLPDTFLIKVRQSWGNISFGDGLLLYYRRYPLEILLSFAFVPLAFLALLKPVRALGAILVIIIAFGFLHFVGYALLHVPPYHWYYVPEIVCFILLGALAVSALWRTPQRGLPRMLVTLIVGLAFLIPALGTLYLFARDGAPLQEAFIHTNWAKPAEYRTVAAWLKTNEAGTSVNSESEVGTIAYYCDCNLLDVFGSRAWVTNMVAKYRGTDPLSLAIRLDYLFYQPQTPFAPAQVTLTTYTQAPPPIPAGLPQWQVSSKWVKHGLIVLRQQ